MINFRNNSAVFKCVPCSAFVVSLCENDYSLLNMFRSRIAFNFRLIDNK
jgi:hypothetical protein